MTDVVPLFSMPARPLDFRIDADVAARALIQRLDKFQLLFQRASRFRTHLYRLEIDEPAQGEANLPVVKLSASVIEQLRTKVGDPVYVTETRWWLGGLHSIHVVVGGESDNSDDVVEIGPEAFELIVTRRRHDNVLKVERLY